MPVKKSTGCTKYNIYYNISVKKRFAADVFENLENTSGLWAIKFLIIFGKERHVLEVILKSIWQASSLEILQRDG